MSVRMLPIFAEVHACWACSPSDVRFRSKNADAIGEAGPDLLENAQIPNALRKGFETRY
jgi:hypothetical protein